jgi:hypothetical protein
MKKILILVVLISFMTHFISCSPKYGCPSNGKNVGAEKLLSGDPAAEKAARKAGKFKS